MAKLHPELQAYLKGFNTDGGADTGAEVAARIQSHLDAQQLAASQQFATQQFDTRMGALRSNLMSMAKNDPAGHDLALDLAEINLRGLSRALDMPDDAHNALLAGMQGDIAHAAVEGLANRSASAARSALTSGRLADLIPDNLKPGLDQYIDTMAQVRSTDALARQAELARQATNASSNRAREWLGGMTDDKTGQLHFPDNWGQRMLQDPMLHPGDKAALLTAQRSLLQNGNPSESDPDLVHSLLTRAALPHNDPDNPSVTEVLSHAGGKLSLADAQFIAGRAGPQDPQTDAASSRIGQVLDEARQQIGNPSAFGRFVNWLLPTLRGGANLDPNSKEYLLTPERMAQFQPTGDDIIQPVLAASAMERQPLGEIFGGDAARQGSAMRRVQGTYNQSNDPWSLWKGVKDVAYDVTQGIPTAIAHGVQDAFGSRGTAGMEELSKAAYEPGNMLPVSGPQSGPSNPAPRETMATMFGKDEPPPPEEQ
jgi:hypothetical protein